MKKSVIFLLCLFLTGCNNVADFFVSDADEKQIGSQYHARLLDTLRILPASDSRSEWIDSLGSHLAQYQDRRNFSKHDFTFSVVDEDVVNAFAVPGGYIYVYTGLIEKAATTDQIAGVLAHEIGHVAAEHYKELVIKISGLNFLSALVSGKSTSGQIAANVAAYLRRMQMTQKNEYEADSLAVAYSAEEGTISPWGMKNFLDILASMDKIYTPEILKTHPDPDKRSVAVKSLIEGEYSYSADRDDNRAKPNF